MAQQPIGEMNIVLSANAATFSEAIDQAQRQLDKLAGKSIQAGHSTVTSVQAASGALRELNGDFTNNIRAVERFITTIPGVGNALKDIFPVVGGLAFASMLGELAYKVVQFADAGSKAAKKMRADFDELNDSTRKTGAELDLANDKLANSIAKLEHTPENLLKLALDEDRKAAYDLAQEIDNASKKVDGLLQKNGIGIARQLGLAVLGQNVSITTGSEKVIRGALTNLRNVTRSSVQDEENAKPGADAEAVKLQNRTKMMNGYAAAIATVNGQLQTVYDRQRKDTDKTNFSAETEMLEDTLDQLKAGRSNLAAGFEHGDLATRQQADEETKARNEQGKQAARQAAEEARKAAEQRLKGMEADLAQEELDRGASIQMEQAFWAARISVFEHGSAQYDQVLEKQRSLARANARKVSEEISRQLAGDKRSSSERAPDVSRGLQGWRLDTMKADAAARDASNELNAIQAANKARLEEVGIGEAAGRTMTRQAAAAAVAAIHTAEYGAELERLILKQRELQALPVTTEEERAQRTKELGDLQDRISQTQANRDVQATQDYFSTHTQDTSAAVGTKDALNELADAARDAAGQARSLFDGVLAGLNRTILEDLTSPSRQGPRHLWTDLGKDTAKSVAGAALTKGEGVLAGAFGFGKLGTKSNPMYTKSADLPTGAASPGSSGLPSISQLLPNLGGEYGRQHRLKVPQRDRRRGELSAGVCGWNGLSSGRMVDGRGARAGTDVCAEGCAGGAA